MFVVNVICSQLQTSDEEIRLAATSLFLPRVFASIHSTRRARLQHGGFCEQILQKAFYSDTRRDSSRFRVEEATIGP
jgi:hypothetical protein